MSQQFQSLLEAQKTAHLQEDNINQLNAQVNEMSTINLHNQEVITAQDQEKEELETFISKQQKLINQMEVRHLKQNSAWEEKITLIQSDNTHIPQQMRLLKILSGLCLTSLILLLTLILWR